MSQPSLKKNFTLSTLYQVLTMIIPFVTAPYISRVLGADGVGIYSYTNSIQMYFSMFAALGTVSYGTREIARNRNDREQRSQLFWEIEFLTILTSIICLIVWGIFIYFSSKYRIYYEILTIAIVSTLLDISWFYIGMEQFTYTVMLNGLFKLLGVVALFVFVRKATDVPTYVLIMSLITLLGNASMWFYLPKFVDKVPFSGLKIKKHFKETLIYFVPTVATSVYTILDKTLIGLLTKDNSQNGYYEQATKIINMAKTLTFASMNSVLGSRISFLFAENKEDEIKERIGFSMEYIMFMGFGIFFGLLSVSERFVPLFFGEGYEPVVYLLYLFGPIVLIIGISNCLGCQYYTPAGLRAISAKFIIIGSCVNLVLNMILIPRLKSEGAVIASLAAETVITILYVKFCNGFFDWRKLFKAAWKKIIAGIIMMSILLFLERKISSNLLGVVVGLSVGSVTYVLSLICLRDAFIVKILKRVGFGR